MDDEASTAPVISYKVGDRVEYLSATHNGWIETEIIEVKSHGRKVRLACRKTTDVRLAEGKVRKAQNDMEVCKKGVRELEGHMSNSPPASSTGSRSRIGKVLKPRASVVEPDPKELRAEAPVAAAGKAARKPHTLVAAALPGLGLARNAGKEKKKELARRKTEEANQKKKDLRTIASQKSEPNVAPAKSLGKLQKVHKGNFAKKHKHRDDGCIGKEAAPLACTARSPVVGEFVKSLDGIRREDKEDGWVLLPGEVATVTALDEDADFQLRNPRGVESSRFIQRKFFAYVQERPSRSSVMAMVGMTPLPLEEEAPSHSIRRPAAEVPKRPRSSALELLTGMTPDVHEELEPPAKKARGRPKAAPEAPVQAAAPQIAEPEPLSKQFKEQLQNKIDQLTEEYLDTVLNFLEEDLGGDDGEEVNLDLNSLTPLRQQQLEKLVDEELGKQQARQDAHARGQRTPAESPIFDIGTDIATPLQSHANTPVEPSVPMSPFHLEASACKSSAMPPLATPTPFPTPSEYGDEQPQQLTPQRPPTPKKLFGDPAQQQPTAGARPVARAGQSVGKLMEDTISRSVRKAVKSTPELTESKTPRLQGAAPSPTLSPKERVPDSMLDVLDEADIMALAEELPGGLGKVADVNTTNPQQVVDDTGISGISGETA